jgi:myo-inositol-1(or 4)-monophosphatase
MDFKELQNAAITAARAAGDVICKGLVTYSRQDITRKSSTDFVTSVDREAESVILAILKDRFPDTPMLAEESGSSGASYPYRWIIDPLDGTTNFIHGYLWVAVSIALERCHEGRLFGEPVLGVILNPFSDQLFTAYEGNGAFLNGERIHVSSVDRLDDALLATGYPFRDRGILNEYLDIFRELFQLCHGIRRAGSAALDFAWLAAGALDGFWEYGLSPWDMAAGAILIREAGGVVTDFWGGDQWLESGNIAAGTSGVHRDILATIQKIGPSK